MSWFKRGKNDMKSSGSDDQLDSRSRASTDPETCLEVFLNHWRQASLVINIKEGQVKGQSLTDDIDTVTQNFEQMITLLAGEEGLNESGQGMPGPIMHYVLEHNVFEKYCNWCNNHPDFAEKLKAEQLRMFEQLISQSSQLLLIHKPVIKPLLRLLTSCSEQSKPGPIEKNLVLLLHQICACSSQETVILETFFNADADHGKAKFLIFSLLIPYIHREGTVGQQARDALLLIMTLSSKHPHIGQFIAENSDFCPVLATGLSALYSSLPRKLVVATDDWHQITQNDITETAELQMFLNSLEFCNAVIQIAHPAVQEQLIDYIYHGFLVPVLGPALHQDVLGLPLPLLDSPMFANSRDEVIAATAYLELFLRRISEPALIKSFLQFILTEQNDEIVILDSLITRIQSSSKLLCVVSLSLFKTLVELNCEDVMFQLVFRYLIPCTHVMVSQRRSVKDLDLYSKSAEKFLSLRPNCCQPSQNEGTKSESSVPQVADRLLEGYGDSNSSKIKPTAINRPKRGLGSFLRARKREKELQLNRSRAQTMLEQPRTAFPPGTFGSKLEHYETNYNDYLAEAKIMLQTCAEACQCWSFRFDGDNPPSNVFCDSFKEDTLKISDTTSLTVGQRTSSELTESEAESVLRASGSSPNVLLSYSHGESSVSLLSLGCERVSSSNSVSNTDSRSAVSHDVSDDVFYSSAMTSSLSEVSEILKRYEKSKDDLRLSNPEEVNSFMTYLNEIHTPPELEESLSDVTAETSMQSLDSLLYNLCSVSITLNTDSSDTSKEYLKQSNATDTSSTTSSKGTTHSCDSKTAKVDYVDGTTFEVIDISQNANNVTNAQKQSVNSTSSDSKCNKQDVTSFVEISMSSLPSNKLSNGNVSPLPLSSTVISQVDGTTVSEETESSSKSVSFSLPNSTMQATSSSSAATTNVPSSSTSNVSAGKPLSQATNISIGPFMMALFSKLEGMMHNSLSVNLLLTGIISQLAAYPQPLLRSFLLNHNLVFQPTVKSLVQVLTSVRQKVDSFSFTIPKFENLLLRARRTLVAREENWRLGQFDPALMQSPKTSNVVYKKTQSPTLNDIANKAKEKRKASLTDLLFRRSPDKRQSVPQRRKGGPQIEIIQSRTGFRYINRHPVEPLGDPMESSKIRHAVFCALVLDEFVKELAALSQEHATLDIKFSCLSVN